MALPCITSKRIDTETSAYLAACYLEYQQQADPVPAATVIKYFGSEPDCSELLQGIPLSNYTQRPNYPGSLSAGLFISIDTQSHDPSLVGPFQEAEKTYQIGWPKQLSQEYEELRTLDYGWDGGNEIAPSETIFSEALRILNDVSVCCGILGKAPVFPEMAPGFRGELGLEYFKTNKELCIDISPAPQKPTITVIEVLKDKHGKIVRMTPRDPSDLLTVVHWFVEDEDI